MAETSVLSKEAILGAKDARVVAVDIPEWGGKVHVRGLSGTERDAFEAWCTEKREKNGVRGLEGVRARLCVLTIVDAEGKRVFADSDAEQLGQKSGQVLERLSKLAMTLAGLIEGEVEELVKGFPGAQSGGSTSV